MINNEIKNRINYLFIKLKKDNRLKAIGLTTLASGITRIIQIVTGIVMVPLTLNYLGEERYGLMMTIISFLGLMSFADLGMGMGVQNKIPALLVSNKLTELKQLISGVFYLLLFIVGILLIIFFIIFPITSWDSFFNIPDGKYGNESKLSVLFFFTCFVLSFPFGLVQRIQDGFQQGYINQIWLSASTLVGFILVFVFIKLKSALPLLILGIYGTNTIFMILNFSYQFLILRPNLFPKFDFAVLRNYKSLLVGGGTFFLLQITNLIFQSADSIIIAKTLGLSEVSIYTIGTKLVNILILPVQIIIPAFLPAFNEAIAKKEYNWIKKNVSRNIFLVLIASFLGACILFFGAEIIIKFWINDSIVLSSSMIFALCAYIFYLNMNCLISYIGLTSIFVKKTSLFYLLAVTLSIFIKILFLDKFGLSGIFWMTMFIFMFFYFIPLIIIFKKQKLF